MRALVSARLRGSFRFLVTRRELTSSVPTVRSCLPFNWRRKRETAGGRDFNEKRMKRSSQRFVPDFCVLTFVSIPTTILNALNVSFSRREKRLYFYDATLRRDRRNIRRDYVQLRRCRRCRNCRGLRSREIKLPLVKVAPTVLAGHSIARAGGDEKNGREIKNLHTLGETEETTMFLRLTNARGHNFRGNVCMNISCNFMGTVLREKLLRVARARIKYDTPSRSDNFTSFMYLEHTGKYINYRRI